MRIGILTFHYALNQGAVLQAYALQTYLERLGHQVEFIDYHPVRKFTIKDYLSKSVNGLYEKIYNKINSMRFVRNKQFSKVLNYGPVRYYSFKDLKEFPPKYDLYIVGSDQVWHFPRFLDQVYLMDWLPNDSNAISFAASLGQTLPPKSLEPSFVNSLLKFRGIGIRESYGVEYICTLLKKSNVSQCLDPTMLLKASDYERIEEKVDVDGNYVASYILTPMNPSHYEILHCVCAQTHCELLNLRNPDTCVILRGFRNKIVTPYQWLYYIKKANVVVCSSFHAVVFSLIYHKPFIVIQPESMKEKGGNLRVLSLLKPLGLSHHCIFCIEDDNVQKILSEDVDWQKVDNKIEGMVVSSANFLNNFIR